MNAVNRPPSLGILGWGRIAQEAWGRALAEAQLEGRIDIERVIERDHHRRAAAAMFFGGAARVAAHAQAHEMSDVDLVLMLTPAESCVDWVGDVLDQTTTRVLAEKPFTLDERRLAGVRQYGIGARLSVVMNYRFRPDVRTALAYIGTGAIGPVVGGSLVSVSQGAWGERDQHGGWRRSRAQNPAGVLGDKGYHLLYLVEELGGDVIRTVRTLRGSTHGAWHADVETVSGGRWDLAASWDLGTHRRDVFTIDGERGSILLPCAVSHPLLVLDAGTRAVRGELDACGSDWWGFTGVLNEWLAGVTTFERHARIASLIGGRFSAPEESQS
jgi:predicted dehydrogenase